MDVESIVYGSLFLAQLLGSALLVAGLFVTEPGSLLIIGGALVFASIGGLAFTATLIDEDDHSLHVPDRTANRLPRFVRGSKR